jgi:hypothetical protein
MSFDQNVVRSECVRENLVVPATGVEDVGLRVPG